MILGKYNQAKTVYFDLFQVDGIDFEPAASFATGDVKIMKNEGAEANTSNLPTDEGQGYSLVLTAAEMSAARIKIYVVDQTGTKVWLDTSVHVETYGNASAEHAFDLDTASTAQTADHTAAIADVPTVSEFNARTLTAAAYFDPAADTVANVTLCATTTTNSDMRGTDSANTVTPDAAGVAPTAVEIRQEMDTNSVDLSTIIAGVADIPNNSEFNARTIVSASYATAANQTTAQTDLDTITGSDGVTLATAQGNYAPNKVVPDAAGTAPTVAEILTTQMTESYAGDGVAPTLAQCLFLIQQSIGDFAIAGTVITTKKLDGSTTAATYTLDDGTNPTSRTRAS